MRITIAYASKHGSTAGVAEAIAERLREHGHDALTATVDQAREIEPGTPVVIGSPIYMGRWMKPAHDLLERLGAEPGERPLYVFSVGPIGDPPKPDDAGPDEDLVPIIADHARSSRVFGGKLDRSELSRLERLAIKAVKAPEGDYRDWEAVQAWADEIAGDLGPAT